MPNELDPDLLDRLETALARLPRATREVFLAHRLDRLSYTQIAARTGLSVAKVERHMARAIHRLSSALDGKPLRWWERLLTLRPWRSAPRPGARSARGRGGGSRRPERRVRTGRTGSVRKDEP